MGTFSAIKLDEDKIIRGTSSKVIRCMCLLHYSLLFVFIVVFSLFSCIAFYR